MGQEVWAVRAAWEVSAVQEVWAVRAAWEVSAAPAIIGSTTRNIAAALRIVTAQPPIASAAPRAAIPWRTAKPARASKSAGKAEISPAIVAEERGAVDLVRAIAEGRAAVDLAGAIAEARAAQIVSAAAIFRAAAEAIATHSAVALAGRGVTTVRAPDRAAAAELRAWVRVEAGAAVPAEGGDDRPRKLWEQ